MPKYTAGIIRNAQIHCKRYKMPKYTAGIIRNAQIYYGIKAPRVSGPPHYQGFSITLRHTTVCYTPLDE